MLHAVNAFHAPQPLQRHKAGVAALERGGPASEFWCGLRYSAPKAPDNEKSLETPGM